MVQEYKLGKFIMCELIKRDRTISWRVTLIVNCRKVNAFFCLCQILKEKKKFNSDEISKFEPLNRICYSKKNVMYCDLFKNKHLFSLNARFWHLHYLNLLNGQLIN